ncbi:MAG: hypothetical protein NZM00_03880, partial [Anaerolinea sp.]|nr:hypothetical protein [Anaerolinea sp.]
RVMAIVQRLTGDGLSFVIASHIPNNALLYAHQVMLMKAGRVLASGAPAQTLTEALLSEAYDIDAEIVYEMADDARIARAVLPRRPRG